VTEERERERESTGQKIAKCDERDRET
jgi:hypothetical protein